jgi:hypothetical protein
MFSLIKVCNKKLLLSIDFLWNHRMHAKHVLGQWFSTFRSRHHSKQNDQKVSPCDPKIGRNLPVEKHWTRAPTVCSRNHGLHKQRN